MGAVMAQMADAFAEDVHFTVRNRKEVVQILGDLAKQRKMLSASFNHGADRIFTSVVGVDYDHDAAYLDVAADDAINKSLLASHKVVFSSTDGLKIQWSSANISCVSLTDGKAFKIGLPDDLIRVQRRECYRFATPVVNPIKCNIPIEGRIVEVALVDLGAGGIGATAMDPLDEAIMEGVEFHNCRIDFPDIGTTDLTLHIRQIIQTTLKNGAVKHRIGMEFVSPSRGNQALIQRYMSKLEREFLATAKDR